MIICHQHRFIFVKTMKTAGTSLEIALSNACGDGDVIARIRPDEPSLSYKKFESAQFENRTTGRRLTIRQHSPLARAIQVFGQDIFDYKIIVSERNPWDKLISSFYWKHHQTPAQLTAGQTRTDYQEDLQEKFKRFVTDPITDPCDAFDMYSHSWMPLTDYIIRFEHLERDLSRVVTELKLPAHVQLPMRAAKGTVRPSGQDLVFDSEMNEAVKRRFAREIAFLGYSSPRAKGRPFKLVDTNLAWREKYWAINSENGWLSKN